MYDLFNSFDDSFGFVLTMRPIIFVLGYSSEFPLLFEKWSDCMDRNQTFMDMEME